MPDCQACPNRSLTRVLGRGSPGGLVLVGETPGREEIRQGEPFVGTSGQLLRATLSEVGVDIKDVYITNTVLCGDGSTPSKAAIQACRPRLIEEIRNAKPRVVLLMGAVALSSVLREAGITQLRGQVRWADELDCPVVLTVHPAAVLRNPDMFRDFESDVKRAKLLLDHPEIPDPVPPELIVCRSPDEAERAICRLRASGSIAVCDVETTGLDPFSDEIIRIGISVDPNVVGIFYPGTFGTLKPYLEDETICWAGHNSIFDAQMLIQTLGIDWRPKFDTLLAHYCVDERPGHRLKDLAGKMFNATKYDFELKKHLEPNAKGFASAPDDVLDVYLGWDCHYTRRLVDPLREAMSEEGVEVIHDHLLVPASQAFRDIELRGVLIDVPYLEELNEKFERRLDDLRTRIRRDARQPQFNPNSFPQVASLVYDRLGIPSRGSRSTAAEILEPHREEFPIIDKILTYRQWSRIRSTYISGLMRRVDKSNCVHPSFLLFGTATGRLACADPNLQNIPVLFGPEIRRAFIAPEGYLVVEADYSQLELRIAALLSQDAVLLNAYYSGQDIHTIVASEVFHVPYDEVTYEQRYIAKYIDFGILYGRGAKSLAEGELQCSVEEAQKYIDHFLGQFPGMSRWIANQHRSVLELGYVVSPIGRRRRFPLILSSFVGDIQRQSVNSPIQGTGSDVCLSALIELSEHFDLDDVRIFSTVHDSVLMYVKEERLVPLCREIREIMTRVPSKLLSTDLPFPVDVEAGRSWGEIEEVIE